MIKIMMTFPASSPLQDSIMCQTCDRKKAEYLIESPTKVFGVYCPECSTPKREAELKKEDQEDLNNNNAIVYMKILKIADLPKAAVETVHKMYGYDAEDYEGQEDLDSRSPRRTLFLALY